MNLSKYIGKTFPAGKTVKELGIDTDRKFVVVEAGHPRFDVGTVLRFLVGEGSMCPVFVDESKHARAVGLSYLAYLEPEDDVRTKNFRVHDKPLSLDEHKKAWLDGKSTTSEGWTVGVDDALDIDEICVGDEVALKGKVESIDTDKNTVAVRFPIGFAGYASIEFHDPESVKNLTRISRKPRTLTKEEATKILAVHLNESITIL